MGNKTDFDFEQRFHFFFALYACWRTSQALAP
jgi:hypothetical protein